MKGIQHITICEKHTNGPKRAAPASGIALWRNSIEIYSYLGLLPRIESVGAYMSKNINYFSKTGKILAKPSDSFTQDFPILCLHREDLQNILVEFLEDCNKDKGAKVDFINGADCISADYQNNQASIELSTGEILTADLIVGADGLHSKIRESISTSLPIYCGYTYYRATLDKSQFASIENSDQWPLHSFESWGKGIRFGFVPLKDPSIFWFASIPSPPLNSPREGNRIFTTQSVSDLEKQFLISKFSNYKGPIDFFELIKSTNESQILRTDIYKIPVLTQWFYGSLVLVGDCAHATSPNLAQGAGLTIEDSIQLAHEIDKVNNSNVSLETALTEYQRKRKPRAHVVQFCADRIATFGQMDKLSPIRDFLMCSATKYFTNLEQKIFSKVVAFTLGKNWTVPFIGKQPSLWKQILKDDFENLPEHMQKFRNSDTGKGEGLCSVEYPNVLKKLIGRILFFPREMTNSPFVASVKNENDAQTWKRIFGYKTKYENIYKTKMKFHNDKNGNGCLMEEKGFFQFFYQVEYQSDKNRIYYCTKQFNLFPGFTLWNFLSPHSEWTETPTETGWKFDGFISLPIVGRIFRYHGTFEIE